MEDGKWKDYVKELEDTRLPLYNKAEIILASRGVIPIAEFSPEYLDVKLLMILEGLGHEHEYLEKTGHMSDTITVSRDGNIIRKYAEAHRNSDISTVGKLNGYPECCVSEYVQVAGTGPMYKKRVKAVLTGRKINVFTLIYVPCETCSFSGVETPSTDLERRVRYTLMEASPKTLSQLDKMRRRKTLIKGVKR